MKHKKLFQMGYVFTVFPLVHFFWAFDNMLNCDTLGDKTLRVATFYSSPNEDSDTALTLGVLIVFRAIHCNAWSFHFATSPKQWAWRISAIHVSGLPIAIVALSGLLMIFEEENKTTGMNFYKDFLPIILMGMSFLYIIARIALLILPFIALCTLLSGTYVQVDWVSFMIYAQHPIASNRIFMHYDTPSYPHIYEVHLREHVQNRDGNDLLHLDIIQPTIGCILPCGIDMYLFLVSLRFIMFSMLSVLAKYTLLQKFFHWLQNILIRGQSYVTMRMRWISHLSSRSMHQKSDYLTTT